MIYITGSAVVVVQKLDKSKKFKWTYIKKKNRSITPGEKNCTHCTRYGFSFFNHIVLWENFCACYCILIEEFYVRFFLHAL